MQLRRERDGEVILTVADDGRARAVANEPRDGRTSMATKVIRALVSQLEGEMEVLYANGTRVEVRMSLPEAA